MEDRARRSDWVTAGVGGLTCLFGLAALMGAGWIQLWDDFEDDTGPQGDTTGHAALWVLAAIVLFAAAVPIFRGRAGWLPGVLVAGVVVAALVADVLAWWF